MTTKSADLRTIVREARKASGLTQVELGERTGIDQSSIRRIEKGFIRQPRPDVIRALAEALDLDVSELLRTSGHLHSTDLPVFAPYMRTKYQDLSPSDIAEIEKFAEEIAKRRGVSLGGPRPGEDE